MGATERRDLEPRRRVRIYSAGTLVATYDHAEVAMATDDVWVVTDRRDGAQVAAFVGMSFICEEDPSREAGLG